MNVVAAAVTGWFLVLGSGGYTSPVSIDEVKLEE